MIIRAEESSDNDAIHDVTVAAFKDIPSLIHEGIPQEVFLCMPFTDAIPQGTVTFHQAFLANG